MVELYGIPEANLIFEVHLASGVVRQHTFDVSGLSIAELVNRLEADSFLANRIVDGIPFLVFEGFPRAFYNINRVELIEMNLEGPPELKEAIEKQPIGFLGRER